MILFILLMIEIKYISSLFWSIFGFCFKKLNKNQYNKEDIQKILKKNKLNQIDNLNSFIKLSINIEEVMPEVKNHKFQMRMVFKLWSS